MSGVGQSPQRKDSIAEILSNDGEDEPFEKVPALKMSSLAPHLLENGRFYVDEKTGVTSTEKKAKKRLRKHDTNCTLKDDFPIYYQMLKEIQ